ncbi:MAG: hypothetical protein JW723_09845 [Bacteroidales bacterium]|nr:hypothetical protein [Bacteroidales bacterium]
MKTNILTGYTQKDISSPDSPDGAILNHLTRDEIIEFSSKINYPIFFREQFGAKKDFHDITGVVTFRHESYFNNPDPDWEKKIIGPQEKIDWIKEHLVINGQ